MYELKLTERAKQNFEVIFKFLAEKNVRFALKTIDGLEKSLLKLEKNPYLYQKRADDKSKRRMPYNDYIVRYIVDDVKKTVIIETVRHAKQKPLKN